MKKWWLHTISCVSNAVITTTILIYFLYEIFTDKATLTFSDGLGLFVVLVGYTIYIISDIWGLKLYARYKNFESVSFTDIGKIQVLLFFLVLVQMFMGYVAYVIIRGLIWQISDGFMGIKNFWDILPYLVLTVFFTALVVLFGYIFLLKAINKNKKIINAEIDNIGN